MIGEINFTYNDITYNLVAHPHLEWHDQDKFVLSEKDTNKVISEEIYSIQQLFTILSEANHVKAKQKKKMSKQSA